MKEALEVQRWEGDFPRLSKSNSFTLDGRKFYMKKIDGIYVLFDVETRVKVLATTTKERAIEYIERNIEECQQRLKSISH